MRVLGGVEVYLHFLVHKRSFAHDTFCQSVVDGRWLSLSFVLNHEVRYWCGFRSVTRSVAHLLAVSDTHPYMCTGNTQTRANNNAQQMWQLLMNQGRSSQHLVEHLFVSLAVATHCYLPLFHNCEQIMLVQTGAVC